MNLVSHRFTKGVTAAGLLILAAMLGGCGRQGPLDLPPSAAAALPVSAEDAGDNTADQAAVAQGNVFDPTPGGKKFLQAPRGQKKRIFLDPLLD